MSAAPATERKMTRLKQQFTQEIAPALMQRFGYSSPMAVPRLGKIVKDHERGQQEKARLADLAEIARGVADAPVELGGQRLDMPLLPRLAGDGVGAAVDRDRDLGHRAFETRLGEDQPSSISLRRPMAESSRPDRASAILRSAA